MRLELASRALHSTLDKFSRFLAEQGMDRALGELCEDLVKDMAWGAGAASSLGLSPRGMLEEIAGALASSRRQPSLLAQLRETLRGSSFLSTS